jgi:hypothetical protein
MSWAILALSSLESWEIRSVIEAGKMDFCGPQRRTESDIKIVRVRAISDATNTVCAYAFLKQR